MENILKKALDEAYTSKWAGELENSADSNYSFSAVFESRIRETAKKAKYPVLFYVNYIAAAAAFVALAIGFAALIPVLGSNKIGVDDNPPVSSGVTASELPINTDDIGIIVTNEADSDENTLTSSVHTTEGTVSMPLFTDSTSVSETDYTDVTPVSSYETTIIITDTPENPIAESGSTETTEIISEDREESNVAQTTENTTDKSPSDTEPIIIITNNTDNLNPGTGIFNPNDDDESYDDDEDDGDDESIIDDGDDYCDVDGDVVVIVPTVQQKTIPIKETFGETLKAINPFAATDRLRLENNSTAYIENESYTINPAYNSCDSVNSYLQGLSDAEYSENADLSGDYINISASDREAFKIIRRYFNNSLWQYYDLYYNNSGSEIDIDDEDDTEDADEANVIVKMSVYRNGYVCISSVINNSENNVVYYGPVYFKADTEKTEELFVNISKMCIPRNLTTVGELINKLSLTSDKITDSYVSVMDIYDTSIGNLPVSPSVISDFLISHCSKKLSTNCSTTNCFIKIDFLSKATDTYMILYINKDGCSVYSGNNNTKYSFDVSNEEIVKFIGMLNKSAGLNIPVYKTFGEYVSDKNFVKIQETMFYYDHKSYHIADPSENAKLLDKIIKTASSAEYKISVGRNAVFNNNLVSVAVDKWLMRLIIAGDKINIGNNVFYVKENYYDEIISFIKTLKSVTVFDNTPIDDFDEETECDD